MWMSSSLDRPKNLFICDDETLPVHTLADIVNFPDKQEKDCDLDKLSFLTVLTPCQFMYNANTPLSYSTLPFNKLQLARVTVITPS